MFATWRARSQQEKMQAAEKARRQRLSTDGFDPLLSRPAEDAPPPVAPPPVAAMRPDAPADEIEEAEVIDVEYAEVSGEAPDGADEPAPDVVSLSVRLEVALSMLREATERLDGANFRIGYLQGQLAEKEERIKLLTAANHKVGIWSRFASWLACR